MKTILNNTYKVITADEGFVITNYDKENILSYNSFKECTCPLNYDTSNFEEVSVEEDRLLTEKKHIAMKERERETN